MSGSNRLREPTARLPNPSSFMMSPPRPARMIRLRSLPYTAVSYAGFRRL